jgi:hypothetical protein
MINFDYEKLRGQPFCPLMGECCNAGSTKSMKGTKCAAWQSLPMTELTTGLAREVHACAVYEWPVQLGFEHSTLLAQGRASIDKVATETRGIQNVFRVAAGQAKLERDLNGDTPLLEKK